MINRRFIMLFFLVSFLAGLSINLNASEVFQVGFRVGVSTIDSSYKYNSRAIARMCDALSGDSETVVSITSYSSPDGNFARNRQLAKLRAASVKDFISCFNNKASVYTVVVAEDWDGVRRYLERSSLEWKDEALAILSSNDGDRKALLQDLWVGEAWEDLMKNCFPSLRRVVVSVSAKASDNHSAVESSDAAIVFSSGSSALLPSFADNSAGFANLKRLAQSSAPTLYIYVKASPEGDEASNQALSLRRAGRIKAKLVSLGYNGEVVTVYQGEDWEGLASNVRESSDLPDKDAVLDILSNSSLDRAARKRALQKLSYGNTWLRLMKEEMTNLRKTVISTEKY